MPRIKKIKLSNKSVNIPASKAFKKEPMTKLKFVINILQGTIAVLTFTLIFTIYAAIVFLSHINKINIAQNPYQNNNLTSGQVIYSNDKISYLPEEMINLDIINNTDESIYLAPCQYFNKFEKKVSDKWQTVSLAVCDEAKTSADSDPIEKISKKIEESFTANKLGEGVWRGVSFVYFGCQKAQIESCLSSKIIYTNEFVISEPERDVSVNSQL